MKLLSRFSARPHVYISYRYDSGDRVSNACIIVKEREQAKRRNGSSLVVNQARVACQNQVECKDLLRMHGVEKHL